MLVNVAQEFVTYPVETVEIVKEFEENGNNEADLPMEDRRMWTDDSTRILIELYQKFNEEFNSGIKKFVWNKIGSHISQVVGMTITGVQCDTKWKGLVKQYKSIKKHNDTSGNDTKYWKFYACMDEILFNKPEINAVATCSSSRGLKEFLETNLQHETTRNNTPSPSTSRCSTPVSNRNKPLKRKVSENAYERRHKEKLERQDRFLNIFEKLVDKLGTDANHCNNCVGDKEN
ncbi:uncharacterized protein LOC116160152 [Photinus pyralis]|uniref:uncharacterized protein LOC116160152 n=1 Tax=Photinus pyralis TaxID=7054 RepID=UPI0012675588|nr:uncharacterized protein LOC116160152 [Photinus pyralis]